MAEVGLKNVRKEFGDITAVNEVPIEVKDGELLVLLGPSGCGKSTTLRLIGGLEYPTEGKIIVGEQDVTDVAPHKRDIAMVFQDLALYPHKSVQENMAFGLKMRGESDEKVNEAVERVAEMLQISELLDRAPSNLSGGQQQRVAIGRAIVRDPQVFLFDEPLSDLDAKLRSDLRTEILELHQELEATMVYVTHDQEEAMTLGNRIAVMNNGEIHQLAEPEIIYNYPADLFVADFIGNPDMNFLDGRVYKSGDQTTIETDIFQLMIDRDLSQWQSRDEVKIRVGIRPEAFYLSGSEIHQVSQSVTISGEIQLIENLGDEHHVHFDAAGKALIASVDHIDREVGDQVEFIVDKTEFHYFDIESGKRITELDDSSIELLSQVDN